MFGDPCHSCTHVTELVWQVTLFWSPAIMLNHLAQPCVSLVQEHGQISNEAPGIVCMGCYGSWMCLSWTLGQEPSHHCLVFLLLSFHVSLYRSHLAYGCSHPIFTGFFSNPSFHFSISYQLILESHPSLPEMITNQRISVTAMLCHVTLNRSKQHPITSPDAAGATRKFWKFPATAPLWQQLGCLDAFVETNCCEKSLTDLHQVDVFGFYP